MKRLSLVFLGSTSACAVYSFQMAEALAKRKDCTLQLIISRRVYNLDEWLSLKSKYGLEVHIFETYKHAAASFLLSFFRFKRFYRILTTIKAFKPDAVYFPFGCTWAPVLFPLLSRRFPIINTIHDPHPHDEFKKLSELLFSKSGEWSQKWVDSIVLLNKADVSYVEKKFKKKVIVIPHAAFSYYERLYDLPFNQGPHCQIGFVGRIEPYKGLDLLVRAFKRIKTTGIKLVIAGGGMVDSETLKTIESSPSICLINKFLTDEEMVKVIQTSDFLVLPYIRASQSGVIPMAFALGKTVVATRVGALCEQVPDGTGLLVNPDEEAISDAIDYLYSEDSLIPDMSENAYNYAKSELSWDRSAQTLMAHIDSAV